MLLDRARKAMGLPSSETAALIGRLHENDRRTRIDKEARLGNIGHCAECHRPYPDIPAGRRYVCPSCAEEEAMQKDPIYIAKASETPAAGQAAGRAFAESASSASPGPSAPSTAPALAGPALPAIKRKKGR